MLSLTVHFNCTYVKLSFDVRSFSSVEEHVTSTVVTCWINIVYGLIEMPHSWGVMEVIVVGQTIEGFVIGRYVFCIQGCATNWKYNHLMMINSKVKRALPVRWLWSKVTIFLPVSLQSEIIWKMPQACTASVFIIILLWSCHFSNTVN